ncbi:MAG: hypothetical protein V3V97_14600, partial [Hyphomicrobiaceae bacterium]
MFELQGAYLSRLLAAMGVAILVSSCAQRSSLEKQTPILPVLDRSVSNTPGMPTTREVEAGAALRRTA